MKLDRLRDPVQIQLPNLDATRQLGKRLADAIKQAGGESAGSGVVISLSGNLGAGKTTLVQGIGKALGVREVINSPTFTMINEYHTGLMPLYHFDFYRVHDMAERADGEAVPLDLLASEFDEISEGRAVLLIEWPEYFIVEGKNYLTSFDRLEIKLTAGTDGELAASEGIDGDESRTARLNSTGALSDALLGAIEDK